MQNWRKHRNFRKYENVDGSFTYVITVDGETVEVSKAIYSAYAEGGYKMENMEALKNDRVLKDADGKAVRDEHGNAVMLPEREISLDKLIEDDWDIPSTSPTPEDIFFFCEGSELEELYRCIALLTKNERMLIDALFFGNGGKGMTERDYTDISGIPQKTINDRKRRILAKIKILMEL